MTTQQIIASVLSGDTNRSFPIADARAAIKASCGQITWSIAGETWAKLAPAKQGTKYPPL